MGLSQHDLRLQALPHRRALRAAADRGASLHARRLQTAGLQRRQGDHAVHDGRHVPEGPELHQGPHQLRDVCFTSSLDGSIQAWNFAAQPFGVERLLPCVSTIKCKALPGKRVGVLRFLLDDEHLLAAFCDDHSIQVFSEESHYSRPEMYLLHEAFSQVSGAVFFDDQKRFATRELDDTLKLFDLRKLDKPYLVMPDLLNSSPIRASASRRQKAWS